MQLSGPLNSRSSLQIVHPNPVILAWISLESQAQPSRPAAQLQRDCPKDAKFVTLTWSIRQEFEEAREMVVDEELDVWQTSASPPRRASRRCFSRLVWMFKGEQMKGTHH